MSRVYNFSAGPAMLPCEVLAQAKDELLDWDQGMSVMEVSHRSKAFTAVVEQSEQRLRQLLSIGDDYAVLFLQGGATSQFSMVPLNLLADAPSADYVNTGAWSKKAIKEAKRYTSVNVVASSEADNFMTIPNRQDWQFSERAGYVHYTDNETIGGVEFGQIPDVGDRLLVSDMSSNMLSRPFDINRFGLVYAGAQKNLGPAGITLVIVRKDLLGRAHPLTPGMFNYQNHLDNDSCFNTPPTFIWYLVNLVFAWVIEQGGLTAMAERNQAKAKRLYQFIDSQDFYHNPVDKRYRSNMNVTFTLANPELEAAFLSGASAAGLMNLKGHRSVGGMRASIYNAMPEQGIIALIDYMQEFLRSST